MASYKGHADIVRLLLEAGAGHTAPNGQGVTLANPQQRCIALTSNDLWLRSKVEFCRTGTAGCLPEIL